MYPWCDDAAHTCKLPQMGIKPSALNGQAIYSIYRLPNGIFSTCLSLLERVTSISLNSTRWCLFINHQLLGCYTNLSGSPCNQFLYKPSAYRNRIVKPGMQLPQAWEPSPVFVPSCLSVCLVANSLKMILPPRTPFPPTVQFKIMVLIY